MSVALALTVFQLAWSAFWGSLHVRIRRGRKYARGRAPAGVVDGLYRRLNPLLFAAQAAFSVACLWSNSSWLLEFQRRLGLRLLGATMLALSVTLTLLAVRHLADNYAPCYDSHLPRTLTTSGPYAFVRHPMYLAKILAGTGSLLLSGSLWLLPSTCYVVAAAWRALRKEEAELKAGVPGFEAYARRTRLLLPYLF